MTGIYKIQSILKPERIYIGSAFDLNHRWSQHCYYLRKNKHHSQQLQNHYNKYGEGDLEFEIIENGDYINRNHLLSREQGWYWRFHYKELEIPYFNVCPLAKSRLGSKSSKETCEKISSGLMGNQYTTGYKHDESFCQKSSENRKKNWQDPVYQKKVSDGLKKYHAEAGKDNPNIIGLRKALAMSHTPEANAKRSAHMKETLRLKKLKKLDIETLD